ncbi:hypothetical protein M885DRAFT_532727 [Pelagophyceae sp. CCMP2097]|nr:hypothetical protein M885DRAFT_532727 [Pelagophyceae sp. CCMP2097]
MFVCCRRRKPAEASQAATEPTVDELEQEARAAIGGTQLRSGEWFSWARTRDAQRFRGTRPAQATLAASRRRRQQLDAASDTSSTAGQFDGSSDGTASWGDAPVKPRFGKLSSALNKLSRVRAAPATPRATAAPDDDSEALKHKPPPPRTSLSRGDAVARKSAELRMLRHNAAPALVQTGLSRNRTPEDQEWHRHHRDVHWRKVKLSKHDAVEARLATQFRSRGPQARNEPEWFETSLYVGDKLTAKICAHAAPSTRRGSAASSGTPAYDADEPQT